MTEKEFILQFVEARIDTLFGALPAKIANRTPEEIREILLAELGPLPEQIKAFAESLSNGSNN